MPNIVDELQEFLAFYNVPKDLVIEIDLELGFAELINGMQLSCYEDGSVSFFKTFANGATEQIDIKPNLDTPPNKLVRRWLHGEEITPLQFEALEDFCAEFGQDPEKWELTDEVNIFACDTPNIELRVGPFNTSKQNTVLMFEQTHTQTLLSPERDSEEINTLLNGEYNILRIGVAATCHQCGTKKLYNLKWQIELNGWASNQAGQYICPTCVDLYQAAFRQ